MFPRWIFYFVLSLGFTIFTFGCEIKCKKNLTYHLLNEPEICCVSPEIVNVLKVNTKAKVFKSKFTKLCSLEIEGEFLEEVKIINTTRLLFLSITSGNSFKKINEQTFGSLKKLTKFYLKAKSIDEIEKDTFKNFNHITDIHLQDNSIKIIHKDAFPINTSLTLLNCSNNLIKNVDFIQKLIKLQLLYLSFNEISDLNPFQNLPSLQKINLSFNKIKILPLNFLKQSNNLIELYLSNNFIEIIPTGIFFNNPNLKVLDLSYNKIKVVGEIFDSFKSPKIYLNNNFLTYLKPENKNFTLFIDNNIWNCKFLNELLTKNNEILFEYTLNFTTSNINGAKCNNSTKKYVYVSKKGELNFKNVILIIVFNIINIVLIIVLVVLNIYCCRKIKGGSISDNNVKVFTNTHSGYLTPTQGHREYEEITENNEAINDNEVMQENHLYIRSISNNFS